MKTIQLLLFAFLASVSFGQGTTWHELPQNPPNPNAGSMSPSSNDLVMADDGTPYSIYIQYNGTNHVFYIDQYVPGTGWTNLFQNPSYGGFQTIHSFKVGGKVYVTARLDNVSLTPIMTVYKIENGAVSIVQNQGFSSLGNGEEFDFIVAQNEQHAYYMYQDLSGFLKCSQLNLTNGSFSEISVPALTSNQYHDMVEFQDTLFVAFSDYVSGAYESKLYKSSSSFTGFQAYHPTATNGTIPTSSTPSPVEFLMSVNYWQNKVSIVTKGNASNLLALYDPSNGTLATSVTNLVPSSNARTASVYDNSGQFFFNQMNDGVSASVEAQVLSLEPNTGISSVVGNFNFNNVQAQSSNFRLMRSFPNHRFVAQYYDIMGSKSRNYLSNEGASLSQTTVVPSICPNTYQKLATIDLEDLNYDNLSIVSVTSTDNVAMEPATVNVQYNYSSGYTNTFSVFGTTGATGSFILTLGVSDGWDTAYLSLPSMSIQTVTAPSFNQNPIYVCSGDGMVDLYQYTSSNTGVFSFNGAAGPMESSLLNASDPNLAFGFSYPISYADSSNGCLASATAFLVVNESPSVTMSVTGTACGASTGMATATTVGGLTPYSDLAWSTGTINATSVNGLAAGIYTFELKDANGCRVLKEFSIQNTGVSVVPTVTPPTCFGQSNGQISLTLNGFSGTPFILWSSGQGSSSITGIPAGTYTVQVSDAANCLITTTVTVPQPAPVVAGTSFVQPTCGNSDGEVQVNATTGGTGTYTYNWSNGFVGAVQTNVPADIYSVLIEDANGCQTSKTIYLSEQGSANLTGSIKATNCGSSNGIIDVTPFLNPGLSVQSISWSNGQTSEDITGLAANNYVCTLIASDGCKAIRGWNVPIVDPLPQPICVISVDSTTSTNLVVWEKTQPVGIVYYNIYRETSLQGEYLLIDTVHSDNLSLFNDVVASPLARSWSYKVSAVNACGVESSLSLPHRTMHLSAFANGTSTEVQWNAYDGTAYSSFTLSRFTPALGWQVIASLPTSQTGYIDPIQFTTPGLDYMVELSLDEPCTATIYKAQDFNATRSNRDKGAFSAGSGTGDSNNSLIESLLETLSIAPNPTSGTVNILASSEQAFHVQLMSLNGNLLQEFEKQGASIDLDLSEYKSGIYFIRIEVEGQSRTHKIIKQ